MRKQHMKVLLAALVVSQLCILADLHIIQYDLKAALERSSSNSQLNKMDAIFDAFSAFIQNATEKGKSKQLSPDEYMVILDIFKHMLEMRKMSEPAGYWHLREG